MTRPFGLLIAVTLLLLLHAGSAHAQEFKYVYPSEIPETGVTETRLWLQQIPSSEQTTYYRNQEQTRQGLGFYSLELESGLTPQLALSGYVDFLQAVGEAPAQSQLRAEARYRLGTPGDGFFNKALYFEYAVPYDGFMEEYERIEARLLLDKIVGDFQFVMNPTLTKNTANRIQRGLEAGFSAGSYWIRHAAFQPGLEYYGEYGRIAGLSSWNGSQEQLAGVIRSHLNDTWSLQLTVAAGLTNTTDRLVTQLILSREPPPHVPLASGMNP